MNEKYTPPFVITPKILNLVVEICENLKILNLNNKHILTPHLRKKNRIKTIRATLAIENNTLNLQQVSAIIEGKAVLGDKNEILEVKNAFNAYEKIMDFNALSIKDLLKAHAIMMQGLIKDNGKFRQDSVGIFKDKKLIHLPPPANFIESHIKNLLSWYKKSELHALIKSSIFHYEFEFIHPFSDGNGRIGRMWQSKLLGIYNEVFYFLPIEEIIKKTQKKYYKALSDSDKSASSEIFVEYMLDSILKAIKELKNDPLNVAINVSINNTQKAILKLIKNKPNITQKEIATKLNLSLKTINRAISNLTTKGYIERIGAKKSGYYKILKN
ncbi:winged helix-turn-helix transcriptional regulator [Helicobacter saguini]|uniref:Winged helix-turn-helix transcriptional regulator n=1 Tax=Helicobacter saguini TaxID=1548018 RepID=A0A6L7DE69_9HELI|nr:Fic family protein [Helicobacter saguini]MWV63015.1 winged helix-turn-helix transcriptional regulator [Helicobacter saguini]MWV66316.1 winged helix-turn-helix transcriptional regulator [Helicobacter saguini]MWV68668.1 winged helix-turn-helix transcriptional regulator [Helicobacter saguini]MWV71781.1 winged helix-turn-helix transcriptional regulator [Helicobacter saguini]